jgi:hypothetical protein
MRNIITCWLILIKNKPPSENSRMWISHCEYAPLVAFK